GAAAGAAARKFFEDTFSKKELPTDIEQISMPAGLALSEIILRSGRVKSRNEARRLITQGGVKIEGRKMTADESVSAPPSFVLQIGKHQFVKVNIAQS
ncbi:MAG: tyrosine--tRNA ligase, partial [Elusimicrobia bacterium]|nr:tyrosine--tRNA ligase [Elusimicrobiota bacterium]